MLLTASPPNESLLFGALAACAVAASCSAIAQWILVPRRQQQRQSKQHGGEEADSIPSRRRDSSPAIHKFAIPKELLEEGGCPHHEEVRVAVDLALEAGNRMVAYSDAKGTDRESLYRLDISEKGRPEDFFTQVDLENERSIACGLLDAFPSHKIIGEEATGTGSIPALTSEPTWIVDPIDGTTNFAAGLPLACVSIGLCRDRIPEVGVVFAPHTQELYVGARGRGAFRNGALLVPSSTSGGGPAQRLAGAVVCAEFGYVRSPDEIDRMVRAVRSVLLSGCRAVRMLGSGVLDLCYVASGRLDVVYAGVASEGWKPWDFCAACVILEEAGCAIEPIYPRGAEAAGSDNQRESSIRSFDLHSTSHICASSQELLEETRRVLLQEN